MTRDTPISTRISRIVIAAVATGISASVGTFLVSDFRQAMKAETARYQSAAFAFAAASSEGVAERDPRKVLELIRGVRNLPDVAYIAALEPNGKVIAEIGGGARLVSPPSQWLSALSTTIEVLADVREGGITIGSIVLRAHAQGLSERYLSASPYATSPPSLSTSASARTSPVG